MTDAPHVSTLDGGLQVVSEHDPTARSISIGVWVGVGNRDEPAEIAGASHFLEHLLFKGSSTRSAREVAEGVDARGGDLNAFTAKEYTAFHARLPADQMDFGFDVLLDVVDDPGFSPAEVDAERHVILEELAWAEDTPDDVAHMALGEALFPGHPLGWEVLGTAETVSSISHDSIRAFHDEWYRRANLVVAAVGPIEHADVVARVERAWAGRPAGVAPERRCPGDAVQPEVVTHRPVEQAHIATAWRGLPHDHPDRYAMAVANQMIGGGWSSRLFQKVREERGMAYTVFSATSAYVDAGALSWYAATSPDRLDELVDVVDAEFADLVDNGPTERELEVARGGFEGATVLALEDTGSRMARLATSMTVRGQVLSIDEQLDAIRAVTADDVQRVLRDVTTADRRASSLVGPMS